MNKFTTVLVFYYSLNKYVMANKQAMKPNDNSCSAGMIPMLLLLSLLSLPPSSLLSSFSVGGDDDEEELLAEFAETKKSDPSLYDW